MPFIKADSAGSGADKKQNDTIASPHGGLSSPDPEVRWRSARALGGRADAVSALAAALGVEPLPRVREAIMTALMRIGDEASVVALLPYLRSQDAGLRATSIEALQSLPDAIMPFMAALLVDADTDVRVLATELARGMPAETATAILVSLLENEPHANVCAAAIDVLAEVGTRDAVPALKACAVRFPDTPFLQFAVSTTIARISDAEV